MRKASTAASAPSSGHGAIPWTWPPACWPEDEEPPQPDVRREPATGSAHVGGPSSPWYISQFIVGETGLTDNDYGGVTGHDHWMHPGQAELEMDPRGESKREEMEDEDLDVEGFGNATDVGSIATGQAHVGPPVTQPQPSNSALQHSHGMLVEEVE